MNFLDDLRYSIRDNLLGFVAIVVIILLVIVYLFFTFTAIVPRWTARTELATQVEAVRSNLVATQGQVLLPEAIQGQLAETAVRRDAAANQFLSEPQAADILNQLYQYAAASGVSIADLQAQVTAGAVSTEEGDAAAKPLYDVRSFFMQVTGDVPALMSFLSLIRETTIPGVELENLNVTAPEDGTRPHTLTANLLLYTSPLSSGAATADLPELEPESDLLPDIPLPVVPTATPVSERAQLEATLHEPWSAENWPEVIHILEQILALSPGDVETTAKLYSAYVNYGYQLLAQQQPEAARVAFAQALTFQPDGADALIGLQTVDAGLATPTPEALTYVVQRGDTLFEIAQRFNTSVDAIRQANNLVGNRIDVGQVLLIPR